MTEAELNGIWNYYLSLENDLAETPRYIEPAGQENVHSFEFAKLLILSCTEIESVFKMICREIVGQQVEGNIAVYKETILTKYPNIIQATVIVNRLGRNICPFAGWSDGRLPWWSAYQQVKHNRGNFFSEATYLNAVSAVAALYILIFYLAKILEISTQKFIGNYIDSEYCYGRLLLPPGMKLPDFEVMPS